MTSTSSGPTRRDMVRISMEVPRLAVEGDRASPLNMEGNIVKRRRRIPPWVALAFGITTITAFCIGVAMMPLTIYNYRRIRSQRAARTVDQLQSVIVPMLREIYNSTVNATKSL